MTDPSAIPEEPRDSRVGTTLADRYRLHRLLDTGAMGRVYVGEHSLMKKRVAVKVLHRELSTVPEFLARFEREAMAAANIDNEHIVAATDFGKLPDGSVYLVLEFVDGKNLRDEIDRGPMPPERALGIARQIAYALDSAHAMGIVHRDLKPENVMLVEKAGDPDFVKVLDFGIAKVPISEAATGPSSKPITKTGMVFGTPEYMPPEQALGQSVDERADIYSLGVMLYEMLAGVRPFGGETAVGTLGQQLSGDPPQFSERVPNVPVHPGVEHLVLRLLAREAAARPQTAREVLGEIDRLLGNPGGRSERLLTLNQGSGSRPNIDAPAIPPPLAASVDESADIPGMSHPLDRLTGWVEARRDRLPSALRQLPAPVLLAAPVAVVGLILGVSLVAALSSGSEAAGTAQRTDSVPAASSEAPASPAGSADKPEAEAKTKTPAVSARASEEALTHARQEGAGALRALAKQYPKDPQIAIALAGVYLEQRNFERSVGAIGDALKLDPSLRENEQVSSALWVTAQNRKSSTAAFELLEGPMGDRGRQILEDLVETRGVRDEIKTRARAALE